MDRLYWLGKWFFLAGGFVGAAEKAAAEAAAGAGAYCGTGDSVDADVDTEGFVSFSTKRYTYASATFYSKPRPLFTSMPS